MQHRRWLPGVAAALMVLVLGGLGVVLRPPWHDELYTLHVASLRAGEILDALRVDSGPPGHYLLCRPLVATGADSVVWLRIPSLLAAAIAAFLVTAAAQRRGRDAAWAAAALMAFHPLVLAAAVEARAYGVLLALATGAMWLTDGVVSRRRAVVLATVLAAACWVHSLGLVLAGAIGVVAVSCASEQRVRVWTAVLAALVAHLPWLGVMVHQPAQSLAWMEGALGRAPEWKRWMLPFAQASPAADSGPWLDLAGLPAVVEGLALSVWTWLVIRGLGDESGRRHALVWAVAVAAVVAVTRLARPIYLPGRTEVLTMAMLVVVAAAGVGRQRFSWVAAAVLAMCGLTTGTLSLVSWATAPAGPDQGIARVLADQARPGDTVVTSGWWLLGVRHALGERANDLQWRTFPADGALHPGWYDDDAALASAPADAAGLAGESRRLWIVRTPALASDRLLDAVVARLGLGLAGHSPLWSVWGPISVPAGGPPPPEP